MSFQMLVLPRVHIFHGFASCCGAKRSLELYPGRRFSGAWIYAIAVGERFSRGFLTAVRENENPLFFRIPSCVIRSPPQDLAGVHDALGVERALETAHHVELDW